MALSANQLTIFMGLQYSGCLPGPVMASPNIALSYPRLYAILAPDTKPITFIKSVSSLKASKAIL